MNWKQIGFILIAAIVLFVGGFIFGFSKRGSQEAAKAAAYVQQIKQLGDQVTTELATRSSQMADLKTAQSHQMTADARVQQLTKQLRERKPLTPIPATGPTMPNNVEPPTINPPADPLKDQLIAAQNQDIAELKEVVTKQALIISNDNVIIQNFQKQESLHNLALQAQIDANRASKWSGRFQGAGITIGVVGVIEIFQHLHH